ncbi:uncharacterized protein LOC117109006 [Anneissia japonica]|uniref:uncharacterized protein LOC117109006 n=1 Tax=Anneissia japonica TaxID=1529436 RepID=UPI001425B881|nr:uncharacterized protein LOC117109006 [Anneissia japonica]
MITNAPILRYYDVNEEVTIQCDASEHGLGATLLQGGQPVYFASQALTMTERKYAQIEKECLAIVFACERFDQFIYGRDIVHVQTDHKPLIPIFQKPIHSALKRLQRMVLKLQKYELKLQHIPGKDMLIADFLSRAFLKNTRKQIMDGKKAKFYYDQKCKDLPDLNIGETVRIQPDQQHSEWRKSKCLQKVGPRSYLVETNDGRKYRRNRKFLRAEKEPSDTQNSQGENMGLATDEVQPTLEPVTNHPSSNVIEPAITQPDNALTKGKPITPVEQTSNIPTQTSVSTRTRSNIQKPARYKDYVMN